MEKRIVRIEIIVIAILIITMGNLLLPVITDSVNTKKQDPVNETEMTKELPIDLTKEFLNKIVYKIKTDYNKSDWINLYNVLGEYAQAQIDPDEIESNFINLKTATGNIQTYTYSHYLYEGGEEDADWFEIHYKCRFDNGKGTIKISTRTVDKISEVVGLNITLDEL